jgi:hypothetical protein
MKLHHYVLLSSLCLCFLTLSPNAKATAIQITEPSGTVEVYLANSSRITSSSLDSTGNVIGSNMAFRIGTFIGGFTPTAANYASWFSNFVGVNGFIAIGGTSSGRLSASITAGDGNLINAPVTSNVGVGADGSLGIASSSLLYAILWNTKYVSNGIIPNTNLGNSFDPSSANLQAAILANSTWTMPSSDSLSLTSYIYSLSSGTTALVGSLDLVNKGITLQAVPEPSTGALMMIGAACLVALRRLRKV